MLLLTWYGTLVCVRGGAAGLTHAALPLSADAGPALSLAGDMLPSPIGGASARIVAHPDLGELSIAAAAAIRCVTIARGNFYLGADPNRPAMAFDRAKAGPRETFLPITEKELASLLDILAHRWIRANTREVIGRDAVRLGENFSLRAGTATIDLPTRLPLIPPGSRTPPARLTLSDANGRADIVRADPVRSAWLAISKWPFGRRRQAELMTLAAHRHVAAREPQQAEFERDVKFLRARRGAAGLSTLIDSLQGNAGVATPAAADRDTTLRGWAMREVAPWRLHPANLGEVTRVMHRLNAIRGWATLFHFVDNNVTLVPKPEGAPDDAGYAYRAEKYLAFFRTVTPALPPDFETTICMSLDDTITERRAIPLFCFQKKYGAPHLLMPDIDFLEHDFYDQPLFTDTLAYAAKTATAVFAGSTTGAMLTADMARSLATPRLRSAAAFTGSARVDFRLPGIAQCLTPEAEAVLAAYPFCQKPPLSWHEQFKSRFVMSIDGNGATCSRVAIALRSQSVLLKYGSEHTLFYFGGMQPWVHYVPVGEDTDVEKILDLEARDPAHFEQIAASGRRFAITHLSKDAVQYYTAMLLQTYAASFSGA